MSFMIMVVYGSGKSDTAWLQGNTCTLRACVYVSFTRVLYQHGLLLASINKPFCI